MSSSHGTSTTEGSAAAAAAAAAAAVKGDNDPLDVMELSGLAYPIGSVVPSIVLGVLEMIDQGELDYKILVMAADHRALQRRWRWRLRCACQALPFIPAIYISCCCCFL
jgi:inorganic pyrophosphatase